jgi:hypothetical protein
MIFKTNNKEIRLVFSTRKIVTVSNLLKGKNFEELYFDAMNKNDLEALSKIIYTFAEDEAGIRSFKNFDEVYDFIDDYKEENKKTYEDVYMELAGAINDEGFFTKKMTKKELQSKISDPLSSIKMDEVIKSSAEKAITKVVEKEAFQGYLG